LSCKELGLPIQQFDIQQEEETAMAQMALLNIEQQALVDVVLQAIHNIIDGEAPQCRAFFLDGPGGSGKTMVYNTLIAHCRSQGVLVASTAWTGIAATLLAGVVLFITCLSCLCPFLTAAFAMSLQLHLMQLTLGQSLCLL
jgi:RecA/RadA recombinase